jgi:hypothetical protein
VKTLGIRPAVPSKGYWASFDRASRSLGVGSWSPSGFGSVSDDPRRSPPVLRKPRLQPGQDAGCVSKIAAAPSKRCVSLSAVHCLGYGEQLNERSEHEDNSSGRPVFPGRNRSGCFMSWFSDLRASPLMPAHSAIPSSLSGEGTPVSGLGTSLACPPDAPPSTVEGNYRRTW